MIYNEKNDFYTWYLFDAEAKLLGKLSTEIAKTLLGKNNPNYTPNKSVCKGVIVINAEKILVSGKKEVDKFYYKHSGTPGGLKIETFKELQKRKPHKIIEQSVKRMLPKGPLGRQIFTRLKVYKGSYHPHVAQKPTKL